MNQQPPIVDTRIIDEFLTLDEIKIILDELSNTGFTPPPHYSSEGHECTIEVIGLKDKNLYPKSPGILLPKMKEIFGDDIQVHGCHILSSYIPYRIHTDGIFGEYGIDDNHYGAWTCVVPLEVCDSSTIIYNEIHLPSKSLEEFTKGKEPVDELTDEFCDKYCSMEIRERMRYLTLDTVFPWSKAGSMLAASRYKFHGSDDFRQNGVAMKKAIIMWTALPYSTK